jgi:hypothetical protein
MTSPNYLSNKQTNSVALSLQENYTDWAIATGQRILAPTFADRGVSRGQHGESPTAINLSFLDWNHYFLFQVAHHLSSQGWVDPIPDPLLLRKFGSTGDTTQDLWVCSQEVWPLDHTVTYVSDITRVMLTKPQTPKPFQMLPKHPILYLD